MSKISTPVQLIGFCCLICCDFATALKITSLKVPDVILTGQPVKLTCYFNLEGDSLYSVTWWKGDVPFFSFQARNSKFSVFHVPGIYVERKKSNLNEVYLSEVTYKTSGWIGCEVVTESPIFEKDAKWSQMIVVERQKKNPKITGNMENKRMGDLLILNCSSFSSYPASNLTWFINGKQASLETIIVYPPEDDGEGRKSSKSGLQMFLQPYHFHSGLLRLQCRSSILDRFSKYTEAEIYDLDYREPTQQGQVAVSSCATTIDWWSISLLFTLFLRKIHERKS